MTSVDDIGRRGILNVVISLLVGESVMKKLESSRNPSMGGHLYSTVTQPRPKERALYMSSKTKSPAQNHRLFAATVGAKVSMWKNVMLMGFSYIIVYSSVAVRTQ